MSKPTINSRRQFEQFIRKIDAKFKKDGVPIHARQIMAIREASMILGVRLIVGPEPIRGSAIPGVYRGRSLSAHIIDWYNNRYGDRLKMDFNLGLSVLQIRGDSWLLKLPTIYGKATATCDRNFETEYPNIVLNKKGDPEKKPIINILKCIEGMSEGLAKDLTDAELVGILKYYLFCHNFFNLLNSHCKKAPLAMAALSDLNSSARYCVSSKSEHGHSRWASLQASEKLLKFFIQSQGKKFPYTHNLSELNKLANQLNLPRIESNIIGYIQCSADVRYELKEHQIEDVVAAHQGAIKVGSVVINKLFPS